MLLTSVAFFMVTLDALVVVTALPSIHRDLGGGIERDHEERHRGQQQGEHPTRRAGP